MRAKQKKKASLFLRALASAGLITLHDPERRNEFEYESSKRQKSNVAARQSRSVSRKPDSRQRKINSLSKAALARRKELRRRRIKVAVALTMTLVLAATVYQIPQMTIFRIQTVSVKGTSAVSDIMVRRAIDRQLDGKSFFNVDTDEISSSVAELPFVHKVSVDRKLPDGIEVTIKEYTPLAFGISGTRGWLVASDGRVLTKARLVDWVGKVPVVRLEKSKIKAGDRVGGEPALRLLRRVPPGFPGTVRGVELGERGLILKMLEGPEIILGRDDELSQKMAVAERMLLLHSPPARKRLKYIDVTVPSRPAVARTDLVL